MQHLLDLPFLVSISVSLEFYASHHFLPCQISHTVFFELFYSYIKFEDHKMITSSYTSPELNGLCMLQAASFLKGLPVYNEKNFSKFQGDPTGRTSYKKPPVYLPTKDSPDSQESKCHGLPYFWCA